jgi:hypothetical protein
METFFECFNSESFDNSIKSFLTTLHFIEKIFNKKNEICLTFSRVKYIINLKNSSFDIIETKFNAFYAE